MSLADVRAGLRSEVPCVLVEAPAGCGKTFEAAALAADIAPTLPDGREVLLLAHTNAAVQEFARRLTKSGASTQVRVATIDSFCLDLLAPYAGSLGLPPQLRRAVGLGTGRIPFAALADKAAELLAVSPTIAKIVGDRFPFIILDEHQDARRDQHLVVELIARAGGSRLRIFGDPMQAIFEDEKEHSIDWAALERSAQLRFTLDGRHRWADSPDLGDWVMNARAELRSGHPLPLRGRPPCVRATWIPSMADAGFGRGDPRLASTPLHSFLDRCGTSRVAVLSRRKLSSLGLHGFSRRRLVVNEGSNAEETAYKYLEAAAAAVGRPERLAGVLLDFLAAVSSGLDATRRRQIDRAFGARDLAESRAQAVRDVADAFAPIYRYADLPGFCEAAQRLLQRPPRWLTIKLPDSLRLLARIRPAAEEDPLAALDRAVALRKISPSRPLRSVGTVHKAKGLEFDHVLVAHFSVTHFADTEFGRKLTYVAISRATRTLELMIPALHPSPLLGARLK